MPVFPAPRLSRSYVLNISGLTRTYALLAAVFRPIAFRVDALPASAAPSNLHRRPAQSMCLFATARTMKGIHASTSSPLSPWRGLNLTDNRRMGLVGWCGLSRLWSRIYYCCILPSFMPPLHSSNFTLAYPNIPFRQQAPSNCCQWRLNFSLTLTVK